MTGLLIALGIAGVLLLGLIVISAPFLLFAHGEREQRDAEAAGEVDA